MPLCPCCGDDHPTGTEVCPRTETGLTTTGSGGTAQPGGPCGSRIDRYEVERLIGTGGMGAVYQARHVLLGQVVAMKLLHPELARRGDMLERFLREARAAASIGNPHIIRVSDCGLTPQGAAFLVMDLLQGESLAELLDREHRLPPPRAAEYVLQVLDGLGAAHDAGIVHRDMKPANVFVTRLPDGRDLVTILDFGISKVADDGPGGSITRTGVVIGTPRYMAPEQMTNPRATDHRADLYATGVILYQLLSGVLPYEAETFAELLVKTATSTPRPLRDAWPEAPPGLVAVIDRAMARDPAARWYDARAFAGALRGAMLDLGASPATAYPSAPGIAATHPAVSHVNPITPPGSSWGSPSSTPAMVAPRMPPTAAMPVFTPTPGWYPAGAAVQTPAPMASPMVTPAPYPVPYPVMVPHPVPMPMPPRQRMSGWVIGGVAVTTTLAVVGAGIGIWLYVLDPGVNKVPTQPESRTHTTDTPTEPAEGPWGIPLIPGVTAPAVPRQQGPIPTPTQPVTVSEPQVVGEMRTAPIREALDRAKPAMDACRRPGHVEQVGILAMLSDDGTMPIVRPSDDNAGDAEVARCVGGRFRDQAPVRNLGGSGIVTFTVTLAAR